MTPEEFEEKLEELWIRFNTSPKLYLKEDYLTLYQIIEELANLHDTRIVELKNNWDEVVASNTLPDGILIKDTIRGIQEKLASIIISLEGVAKEETSLEILTAIENIDIDLTPVEEKVDEVSNKVDSIAADLDGVAQEATSQSILTAVENIDIDTSDLAKEATLQGVGSDAAAAKTAAQNAETAAGQAKTAAEAAEAAIQQIINAHILGYSLGGYTFINGFTPEGAGSLLVNRDKISAIDDDNITSFSTISNELFRSCGNLTKVRYNNLVSVPANAFVNSSVKKVYLPSLSISGIRVFQNVASVEEIDVRNLSTMPQEFVFGCSKLYYLNASNCSLLISQCFRSAPSIIDMIIGGNFSGSMNFSSVYYDPYNAYSTSIDTLCFPDDQDKYGRTFANNWEKWKWCIINHFAANLQDRTGMNAYTITFGSTVLLHFDAEMIAAFTDKNWTLA